MPDWSNIFNILFVAVGGALSLFFLISVICVAVKGKRRCNAFDVILRILSTLAFIAAVALFAVAVLTMLSGSVCIKFETTEGAETATPVLVFMSQNIKLPLADLFVMMTTTLGSELALVLLVCSLAALIVDCLVANKRGDKKAKAVKAQKTPEQLKREAEIAKIQRIGEQAVRKTESAASAQASPTQTQKPETDWREPVQDQPHKTEFVGIKEQTDDFDTFDAFDDTSEQESVAEGEFEEMSELEQEQADIVEDETDELRQEEEQAWNEPDQEPESKEDEQGVAYDEPEAANESEFIEEESEIEDEQEDTVEQGWNEPEIEDEPEIENEANNVDLSDIEPDRDIYIPDIKTITRAAERPSAAKPVRSRSGKPKTAAAPSGKKRSSSGNGGATKATPTKSAAKPSAATKPATTRRTETPATSQKLPVTKRYVILDRRSAANMFGEYLKERDREAKDKLTSSINTIIIE